MKINKYSNSFIRHCLSDRIFFDQTLFHYLDTRKCIEGKENLSMLLKDTCKFYFLSEWWYRFKYCI